MSIEAVTTAIVGYAETCVPTAWCMSSNLRAQE
jgi:hypothetical protein